jgi:hypothetical protein
MTGIVRKGDVVEIVAKGIVIVGKVTMAENSVPFAGAAVEHNLTVAGDDGRTYQWKEWLDGGTVAIVEGGPVETEEEWNDRQWRENE